jgi:transcriptional regulator with XRE-family HTH domain
MKLSAHAREKLARAIRERIKELGWNYSQISLQAGVDASQVSRICRGNFKTPSFNVMQVCAALGIDWKEAESAESNADLDQRRIEKSVIAIWDRSPKDADRLVKLLKDLAELRRSGSHK